MGKWRQYILAVMNGRRPFDLSGVDFRLPIEGRIDEVMVNKRWSFYRYQLEILKKTAEPLQLANALVDESPIMLYPCDESSYVTWKAEENMLYEFYPHQIVQALRLTKPATIRQYQFIPKLMGFYLIDDRLCLQVTSQKYKLRNILA